MDNNKSGKLMADEVEKILKFRADNNISAMSLVVTGVDLLTFQAYVSEEDNEELNSTIASCVKCGIQVGSARIKDAYDLLDADDKIH